MLREVIITKVFRGIISKKYFVPSSLLESYSSGTSFSTNRALVKNNNNCFKLSKVIELGNYFKSKPFGQSKM